MYLAYGMEAVHDTTNCCKLPLISVLGLEKFLYEHYCLFLCMFIWTLQKVRLCLVLTLESSLYCYSDFLSDLILIIFFMWLQFCEPRNLKLLSLLTQIFSSKQKDSRLLAWQWPDFKFKVLLDPYDLLGPHVTGLCIRTSYNNWITWNFSWVLDGFLQL